MNKYVDKILLTICSKLQLPEYLYKLADERYHTIATIIASATATIRK